MRVAPPLSRTRLTSVIAAVLLTPALLAGCSSGGAGETAAAAPDDSPVVELTPGVFVPSAAPTGASSPAAAPPTAPTAAAPTRAAAAATTTWPDGTQLRGTVTVPAGSTVTLAPGATVTAAKGSKLVVAGTLLATRGLLTGADWDGVTVARGGALRLTGTSIAGAKNGLSTAEGAKPSAFAGGTISRATYPLSVAAGTTLTLSDVKVRETSGASDVQGTLVADRLSYDKAGNPGIVIGGVLRLTRSELYGNGDFDGDMLNTADAKELTVSDTTIRDVHCAFHLIGVARLTLTRLTIRDNAYGFMAYGSSPTAVHRITDTDVYGNRDYGLHETPGTKQGRILVDGGYWGDNGDGATDDISQFSGKVERTRAASAPRK